MSGRPTLRIFQFDLDDLEVAARSVKQGLTRNESRHGDIKIFMAVARKLAREETYGDFDIVLDHYFSSVAQLHATPHAPRDMLYWVSMLVSC